MKNKKMRGIKIILLLLLVAVVFVAVVEFFVFQGKDVIQTPFVQIGNVRVSVEVMDTDALRERGLSGRESIGEKEGMLFIFPWKGMYGFWMKDMKFLIDIVWISNDKVVGFEESVDPQIGAQTSELKIYYPPEPVDRVLELAGGNFTSLGGKVGDSIFVISKN